MYSASRLISCHILLSRLGKYIQSIFKYFQMIHKTFIVWLANEKLNTVCDYFHLMSILSNYINQIQRNVLIYVKFRFNMLKIFYPTWDKWKIHILILCLTWLSLHKQFSNCCFFFFFSLTISLHIISPFKNVQCDKRFSVE